MNNVKNLKHLKNLKNLKNLRGMEGGVGRWEGEGRGLATFVLYSMHAILKTLVHVVFLPNSFNLYSNCSNVKIIFNLLIVLTL